MRARHFQYGVDVSLDTNRAVQCEWSMSATESEAGQQSRETIAMITVQVTNKYMT